MRCNDPCTTRWAQWARRLFFCSRASVRNTCGQITRSPKGRGSSPAAGVGSATTGKDNTLVGLSLPRNCAFRRRLSVGPTTDTPISRPAARRPSAVFAHTVRSRRGGAHARTLLRTSTLTLVRPFADLRAPVAFAAAVAADDALTSCHSGPRRPSQCVGPEDDARRPVHRRT